MAAAKYFFIFALFYTGHCNPLGQTTLCESAQPYPTGSATVCESTPNLPYFSLPLGGLGAAGLLPTSLGLPGLPYSGLRSITGLAGLGYANSPYGMPLGLPYGLPAVTPGSSTVCESSPNMLGVGPLGGLPLSLTGLGLGSLGFGGLGLGGQGLGGQGLGGQGLGGLGLGGLGLGGLGYGLGPTAVPLL